jgi:hypothetical protein
VAVDNHDRKFLEVESQKLAVNLTFDSLLSAKKTVEKVTVELGLQETSVADARASLDAAKLANDQAQASFNMAD